MKKRKSSFKRFVSIFLVLTVMFVLVFNSLFSINSFTATNNSVLSDSFDSYTTGNFTGSGTSSSVWPHVNTWGTLSIAEDPSSVDKSAKISTNATVGNQSRLYNSLTSLNGYKLAYEFKTKIVQEDDAKNFIYWYVLKHSNGKSTNIMYVPHSTSTIKSTNDTTDTDLSYSYTTNTWMDVKVVVDIIAEKYDLYIDDTKITSTPRYLKDASTADYSTGGFTDIGYQVYTNTAGKTTSMYVNDVDVYTLITDMSESFDSYTTGNFTGSGTSSSVWPHTNTWGTLSIAEDPSSTDKSAKVSANSTVGNQSRLYHTLDTLSGNELSYEFKTKIEQEDNAKNFSYWYAIKHSNGKSTNIIYIPHSTSTIKSTNGTTDTDLSYSYSTNTWFNVKVVVDIVNEEYDLYIDDVKINSTPRKLKDASTADYSTGGFTDIGYQAYTNTAGKTTSMYVDDVKVNTSATNPTEAPFVSSISIEGSSRVGNTLTGTYDYYDANGDAESGSLYRWLRASSISGSYTEISGATNSSYTLTEDDVGKYMKFEVTPKNNISPNTGIKGEFILSTPVIISVTYYVDDANGDNNNDGKSLSTPFKTIQQAASIMLPNDICMIRGGTYRETITPTNSGTSSKPITFQNYQDETVIISGCDIVSNWTQYSGSIYSADVNMTFGDNNIVFDDGQLMTEARWPNNTGTLLQPTLATVDSGTQNTIVDASLTQADDYFNGAKLWCIGGREWIAQSTTITDYINSTHELQFDSFASTGWAYVPEEGNKYWITGKLELLDTSGEWYYDSSNGKIYMWGFNGVNPGSGIVEVKTRSNAFNLDNRSYINIEAIEINGAGISTNNNTTNCTISNCLISNVSPTIIISGSNNTIKNSILKNSNGGILKITGSNNKVVNNLIEQGGFIPNWGALLEVDGKDHLISHNTIRDAARACIAVRAINSQIQYNDIYNAGWLTSDLGIFYVANSDGGNTRIHHNKLHDNKAHEYGAGIYLDSICNNYIVDHNIIWNTNFSGVTLNTPNNYSLIYNNTVYNVPWSFQHGGGASYKYDHFGVRVFNNIFTSNIFKPIGGGVFGNNLYSSTDPKFVDASSLDFRLQATSPAIDAGKIIDGITDGYINTPDIGAYEYGGADWTAGHDFNNPPSVSLATINTEFMNRISNGSFEQGSSVPWIKTGAQTATVIYSTAWNYSLSSAKAQLYHLRLGGGVDGVKQTVSGLSPNTSYTFSVWLKADEGEVIQAGVMDYGDNTVIKDVYDNLYTQVIIDFTTGENNTEATVFINKTSTSSGYAYADNAGLVKKDIQIKEESFENGLSTWTRVYNNENLSSSVVRSGSYSYAVDSDTDLIARDLGASYNKIAVMWFYDDATDDSAKAMARIDEGVVSDSYSWRGLGLDTGVSTTRYVYRIGTNTTVTNVLRTTGWHELKWDYTSGSKVDMYIDGVLVASTTGVTSFSKVAMGDWWADGKISSSYFDDFAIYDYAFSWGTFENGFGGWSSNYGTPLTSTVQKKTGNMSYVTSEDQDEIVKKLTESYNKVASIWFYDDASDTSMTCVADVTMSGNGMRAIGVDTTTSASKYVYNVGGSFVQTNITRTTGWHNFEWDYTSGSGVDFYIDGIYVGSASGINTFNEIALGDRWNDGKIGTVYFDEIAIKDRIIIGESFENGLGKWNRVYNNEATSGVNAYSGSNSYIVDNDTDLISRDLGKSYNKKVVIWFYDDATDNSVMCMARVDEGVVSDSYSWRGLGINTYSSSTNYVYRVGNTTTVSNIQRSTGWHELRWDYTSGTKVDMYIDGNLVASPTGVTTFSKVAMGDWWADGNTGNNYFDDFAVLE